MTIAERLAAAIDALPSERRVIVAIDGPDAAGKTTMASAIAAHLSRPTVIAAIDGWHNPRHCDAGSCRPRATSWTHSI